MRAHEEAVLECSTGAWGAHWVCARNLTPTPNTQSPMRGASALPNQRLGRDTPETAIGAPTLSALHKLQAPTPTASASSSEEGSVSSGSEGPGMRRNYTAMAALSDTYHGPVSALDTRATPVADGGSPLRRNISASTLCELRRREQVATRSDASLQGSRAAVVEAVACKILEHILGDDVAHAAMRDHIAASAGAPADSGSGSSTPVGGSRTSSRQASRDTSCIDNEAAEAAAAVAAAQDAAKLEGVPPGISQSLQAYILTIVRHLELPNSCIVAALIYVQRAVSGTRFTLSVTNWQPCLLAAFVIAAKLSFDEPVWNEDFVKALRISNVQV